MPLSFLIDEDVDHSVGNLLAATNAVAHVDEVLVAGAKDRVVEQYARSRGMILITGDRRFAARLRQRDRRWSCLFLHDLYTEERNRVAQLLDVIEREAELAGDRFWMEIRSHSYTIER